MKLDDLIRYICAFESAKEQAKEMSHFAAKCRTRNNWKQPNTDDAHVKPKTEKIRCIREDDDDDATSSSNFIFNIGDGDDLIWCKIGGILIEMLTDSGSAHNIIDEHSWEYLKKSGIKVQNMNKTVHRELRAYAQTKPLEIISSFEADILIADVDKDLVAQAKFYVIRGGTQPLLGKITAKLLGVLVLGLPSTRQNQVNQLEDNPAITPFPKLKGIRLLIPIDKDVTHVSQHARRPPIALLSKVEEKLDELLKADIIEPVRGHSDWVSPIVVIAKDNGDIRLCVDMRQVNKAVEIS
uniref:Peptidase A2 domain-containing protein n=1 Tax=Phlebotomus papatasi TaxID=29031 RepID=A0A1B0DI56_PHLPP